MTRPVVTYNISKAKKIPSNEVLLDVLRNNAVMLVFDVGQKKLQEEVGKDLRKEQHKENQRAEKK